MAPRTKHSPLLHLVRIADDFEGRVISNGVLRAGLRLRLVLVPAARALEDQLHAGKEVGDRLRGAGVRGDGLHTVAERFEVQIEAQPVVRKARVPVRGGVRGVREGELGDDDEDVGQTRPFGEGEVPVGGSGWGEERVKVGLA